MAINLWKLARKPASYNPLPLGYVNNINVNLFDSFIMRVRAKSQSSGRLRLQANNTSQPLSSGVFTLNNEFKLYEVELKANNNDNRLYIYDLDSKGDIEVRDIELVQKPLPKLTINGVDGFLSGKWSLHANAKVIDDETLELNATASNQLSSVKIPVLPNTVYTYSIIQQPGIWNRIDYRDSTGAVISINQAQSFPLTFTTPSNCFEIVVAMTNTATGKIIFKRPVLNLGSIPAPYEPKRGERMVLPTPKKNLFDKTTVTLDKYLSTTGTLLTSSAGNSSSEFISVKKSTSYLVSGLVINPTTHNICFFDGAKNFISYASVVYATDGAKKQITTPSNAVYLRFSFNKDNLDIIQLEEGIVATPYEPYAVQLNKKPAIPVRMAKKTRVAKKVREAIR